MSRLDLSRTYDGEKLQVITSSFIPSRVQFLSPRPGGAALKTLSFLFLQAVLFTGLLLPSAVHGQTPPPDFRFSATTGGVAPWAEKARITVDNTGQARYIRYTTDNPPTILADTSFTIGVTGLQGLWKIIQDSSFFSINPTWINSAAHDGMFAKITVTANSATHQVRISNIAQPGIQGIITILNSVVPPELQLPYSPPQGFDATPRDPCSTLLGKVGSPVDVDAKLRSSRDLKSRLFPGPYLSSISGATSVEPSHPGTAVACDVTIQDAIANGWASFSSKGDYFGDDVSIRVNNQNHPPCNTIDITLYLEFWGPPASEARIEKVCADIASKWAGATTSGGQKVEISFVTRSNTDATSPPNTPGFHEIQLVPKGSVRSHVTGDAGVNSGTDSGIWEVPSPVGTFAHEAGHLMGLPDRYIDFNKQPDGSWVNSQTNQSFANDDAFANYLVSRNLGQDSNSLKDFLKDIDTYSVPMDGRENDLMANVSKPLSQADIDLIAANPGLLVSVPDGTVLVNRDNGEQNLIVTRRDDVFAGPGQTRTLNGIYAACIDHFKGIPSARGVFDVTLPVSQWTGIQAAGYMAKLIHYVDSLTLYCHMNFSTQEAIWRLSDNAVPFFDFDNSTDSLFARAGIDVSDRLLDFPRLTGSGLGDSLSHPFIPNELYVADIHPAFTNGKVGTSTSLTARISVPAGAPKSVGIAWTATGPDGAAVSISGKDSTASLTPTRSGVYVVGVQLSTNDSIQGQKTFSSSRKGYVIVPDDYTESFEHPNLTDKYPWETYGDAPWTISSHNPETGDYSAQPGLISSGQSSTLAIEISLPAESDIVFSVRTFTSGFSDGLLFMVDSVWHDRFDGASDWTVHKYRLQAGKHILSWEFSTLSSTPANGAWLDNIFFPGNVVVTSVGKAAPDIPRVFALEQNYPNPFNPTTVIDYQLPAASEVRLIVYDMLGRQVAVLVNGMKAPGRYDVEFDATAHASGVYFYTLTAGAFVQTRKMIVVK